MYWLGGQNSLSWLWQPGFHRHPLLQLPHGIGHSACFVCAVAQGGDRLVNHCSLAMGASPKRYFGFAPVQEVLPKRSVVEAQSLVLD